MQITYCFPGGRFKALTMSYDDGRVLTAAWLKFSTNTV